MPETPNPFHQYAEEIGAFLAEARAQDAERIRRQVSNDGPSENTD
jgi:hypothetical protein